MVRMPEGDDFRCTGVAAGCENGSFVRFGPAVCKEGLRQLALGCDLSDSLCKGCLRFVGEDRGDVLELVNLGVNFRVYGFVAVADADSHDAAEKVEVLVSVSVPDVLIFGPVDNQRLLIEVKYGGEQVFPLGKEN